MKNYIFFLFTLLTLTSCSESKESKILKNTKMYTEDYFFKNNFKVEIVDFRIINYKELNLFEADSLIKKFAKEKMLNIAINYSGLKSTDFFSPSNSRMLEFVDEAGKSRELDLYLNKLKEMKNTGYEVHVYLKYITADLNNYNKRNHLIEDCMYLLDKDFKVVDRMNLK